MKKQLENMERVEEQRKLIDRVLKGEQIANSEWFAWVANARDCNVFLKNMSPEDELKVFLRLSEAIQVFGPIYTAKGWGGLITLAEKHLIEKGRELVIGFMSDLKKNQDKVDSLTLQLNRYKYEVVPSLQTKLNEKEAIRKALEENGNNIKKVACVLNMTQRDLRIKIVEYEL